MDRDRLATEFGLYTNWIVEAVASLPGVDPVPAACRGTGHPALLVDLAEAIEARPGMLVLDAGCGMGGPAAWLRRHRGCATIGIDLMEENIEASRALFGDAASAVASASALPFRNDVFDAVWAIGVVEMFADKPHAFAEFGRVLKCGGRIVVYSFVAQASELSEGPSSNSFASPIALRSFIENAGLAVVNGGPAPVVPALPRDWSEARNAIVDEVRARHQHDDDFERVRSELDRFNRLRSAGQIEPWRYELIKPGP
jgi:ubiquinone/menaquinone biosynthesis C-methylase UbiE